MGHKKRNPGGQPGQRSRLWARAETQTVGALDKRPKYSTGKVEKDTTQ